MRFLFLIFVLWISYSAMAQTIIETDLRCKSKNYYANKAYSQGTEEVEFKRYKNAVSYLEYSVKLDTAFCDA